MISRRNLISCSTWAMVITHPKDRSRNNLLGFVVTETKLKLRRIDVMMKFFYASRRSAAASLAVIGLMSLQLVARACAFLGQSTTYDINSGIYCSHWALTHTNQNNDCYSCVEQYCSSYYGVSCWNWLGQTNTCTTTGDQYCGS